MNEVNDFYVGYLPKAPAALARFVKKIVAGLGLLALAVALVLVTAQMPFANSAFEFGKLRNFEGVLVAQPYPTLLVARAGHTGSQDAYSSYLLVAPGKHGADALISGFDGKTVRSARPIDLSRGRDDGGSRARLDYAAE